MKDAVMPISNAEAQRRWRDKRDALAKEAKHLRNASLKHLITEREERGSITAKTRRLAVQQLLKDIDPEEDAELIAWLRTWEAP